jgi:hypothetical protein
MVGLFSPGEQPGSGERDERFFGGAAQLAKSANARRVFL